MKKLIISTKEQFGYLTDTFKYCEYLNSKYDITYVCLDDKLKKMEIDNINVIYVKKTKKLWLNLIKLNYYTILNTYKINADILFLVYNPLIFITRLLTYGKRSILDIRTGNVDNNKIKRKKANRRILINSKIFKEITVISEGLANLLNIKKYNVLPLGADINQNNSNKKYECIDLIYIGSLNNRNIIDTIDGFKMFSEKNDIKSRYRIIGFFKDEKSDEAVEFYKAIEKCDKIEFLGRKTHSELQKYLDESNIGISYIPITEYYNVQPPTKTFEYLANGLACIATNTTENRKIIEKHNGICCSDNPKSFYNALEDITKIKDSFNSEEIKESIREYDWKYIVNNILTNIIER